MFNVAASHHNMPAEVFNYLSVHKRDCRPINLPTLVIFYIVL